LIPWRLAIGGGVIIIVAVVGILKLSPFCEWRDSGTNCDYRVMMAVIDAVSDCGFNGC